MSRHARDPGLQAERTSLAWTRTAIGLLLHGIVHLRIAFVTGSTVLTALSIAMIGFACAAFCIGRSRRAMLTRGHPPAPVPVASIRLMAASGITVCLSALVAIASRGPGP